MDKREIGELLLKLGVVLFVIGAVVCITRQLPADEFTGIGVLALIFMGVGANMAGARIKGTNHAFAGTSKSTICPDSTNGPCW